MKRIVSKCEFDVLTISYSIDYLAHFPGLTLLNNRTRIKYDVTQVIRHFLVRSLYDI